MVPATPRVVVATFRPLPVEAHERRRCISDLVLVFAFTTAASEEDAVDSCVRVRINRRLACRDCGLNVR